MKVAGIIAEYNPFHRGHQYHIAETRRAGATHVVAVMSGSFVQRGDFALFSKWTRAQAAVRGGVDLVLELPAVYSLSCAERFARAGVALLDRLGGVDLLSFGSESGTLSPLYAALNMIEAAELGIQKALRTGQSYPQAMANAVAALQPSQLSLEGAVALLTPNNILGVEYLRALQTLGSEIKPFTVRRCGAEHDQAPPSPAMRGEAPFLDVTSPPCAEEGGAGAVSKSARPIPPSVISAAAPPPRGSDLHRGDSAGAAAPSQYGREALTASAKACRELILTHGLTAAEPYLAHGNLLAGELASGIAPCTWHNADRALLTLLRNASFSQTAGLSEGIENRFFKFLPGVSTAAELLSLVKTRRYTEARIRRIALCAALGITEAMQCEPPPYLRVLALNRRGAELLRRAAAPVVTKPSKLLEADGPSADIFAAEQRAGALFSLSSPVPRPGNLEVTTSPVFVEDAKTL